MLKRWLIKLAVAASLVLCVAVSALWVRSYSHLVAIVPVRTETRLYGVSVLRGGIYLLRTDAPPQFEQPRVIHAPLRDGVQYMTVPHTFGGFGYMRASEGFPALRVPAWFVVLLPAAFIVVVVRRVARRARRRRAGQCSACGYDLRATPGRCPECGTVPQPPHDPTLYPR